MEGLTFAWSMSSSNSELEALATLDSLTSPSMIHFGDLAETVPIGTYSLSITVSAEGVTSSAMTVDVVICGSDVWKVKVDTVPGCDGTCDITATYEGGYSTALGNAAYTALAYYSDEETLVDQFCLDLEWYINQSGSEKGEYYSMDSTIAEQILLDDATNPSQLVLPAFEEKVQSGGSYNFNIHVLDTITDTYSG